MHSVLDSRFLLRVLRPKLQHVANNFSSVVLRFDARLSAGIVPGDRANRQSQLSQNRRRVPQNRPIHRTVGGSGREWPCLAARDTEPGRASDLLTGGPDSIPRALTAFLVAIAYYHPPFYANPARRHTAKPSNYASPETKDRPNRHPGSPALASNVRNRRRSRATLDRCVGKRGGLSLVLGLDGMWNLKCVNNL